MTALVAALEPAADSLQTLDAIAWARLDWWWAAGSLLLTLAALWWGIRAHRRAVAALGNTRLVSRLLASVHHGNRQLATALVLLAMTCMVTALLRPQYGGKSKVIPVSGLDVILAVDYSKSMLAADVYPSRSERLEAELAHFLDDASRRGDRVGVVIFAGQARGFPVTADMRILKTFLQEADPLTENPGGTAIGPALNKALDFLVEARSGANDRPFNAQPAAEQDASAIPPAENDQAIILLTDGEDTVSRPLDVAKKAAQLGVRIYTVGIGSKSGEPIRTYDEDGKPAGFVTDDEGNYVMTRIDEDLLRQIAEKTNGRYVHVDPAKFGLDEVRSLLEGLSRSKRDISIEILRDEGYYFFLWPALALLSIALALPHRRHRSP